MPIVRSFVLAAAASFLALGSSIASAATPASGSPGKLLIISAQASSQLPVCQATGAVGSQCRQEEQTCQWVARGVNGIDLACRNKTGGWMLGGVGVGVAVGAALGLSGGSSSP